MTEIRRARSEDAPALTRIALAAKRYWGYPERWIEFWTPALTITPALISQHSVFVAIAAAQPTGFYALSRNRKLGTLEHLWIDPEHIGTGVGRRLVEHATRCAAQIGVEVIEIESDPHAEGFYLRMGARRVGEHVTEIEGRPRVLPVLRLDVPAKLQGGDNDNSAADL